MANFSSFNDSLVATGYLSLDDLSEFVDWQQACRSVLLAPAVNGVFTATSLLVFFLPLLLLYHMLIVGAGRVRPKLNDDDNGPNSEEGELDLSCARATGGPPVPPCGPRWPPAMHHPPCGT